MWGITLYEVWYHIMALFVGIAVYGGIDHWFPEES